MCEEIIIKTPEQIEKIKAAGHVLAELYHELKSYIKPGVSTLQIDAFADKL